MRPRRKRTQAKQRREYVRDIKYLERDDVQRLIDACTSARDALMLKLLYATFCRVNELTTMRVCDVKFSRCLIHVRAEVTKTKTGRLVIIPPVLRDELEDYLKEQGRCDPLSSAYIFQSRQAGRFTNRRVDQIVVAAASRAGLQEVYANTKDGRRLFAVTCHTLRHSGIIFALNQGVPQSAIMEQSGHVSLQSFQIYARFSVRDRQRYFSERQVYDLVTVKHA